MSRSIYVASSWRNAFHPTTVDALRKAGHAVFDYRHPDLRDPDNNGFHWREIDSLYHQWDGQEFLRALSNPIADAGYSRDFNAMRWADTCVLIEPSGRSAHLEAGWFAGAGKETFVLIAEYDEPELMLKLVDEVFVPKSGAAWWTALDALVERLTQPVRKQSYQARLLATEQVWQAEFAGAMAFYTGEPATANCYPSHSELWHAWNDGHQRARQSEVADQATELLETLEWAAQHPLGITEGFRYQVPDWALNPALPSCPSCRQSRDYQGHASDCRLAKQLGRTTGEPVRPTLTDAPPVLTPSS